jgi:hypothetical protein
MEEGFVTINIFRHGKSAWSSWTLLFTGAFHLSCVVFVTSAGGVFNYVLFYDKLTLSLC